METITVHGWSTHPLAFREDKLIFLRNEEGLTFTYMPFWELEYYLALCGGEFVYRKELLPNRFYWFNLWPEVHRIVIPENIIASLPRWADNFYWPMARWAYEYLGRERQHLLPTTAEFGVLEPEPPF